MPSWPAVSSAFASSSAARSRSPGPSRSSSVSAHSHEVRAAQGLAPIVEFRSKACAKWRSASLHLPMPPASLRQPCNRADARARRCESVPFCEAGGARRSDRGRPAHSQGGSRPPASEPRRSNRHSAEARRSRPRPTSGARACRTHFPQLRCNVGPDAPQDVVQSETAPGVRELPFDFP